jgi:pyridoxine 5-phosphate synthase
MEGAGLARRQAAAALAQHSRREAGEQRLGVSKLRLGVNIDHVATVRNARGGDNPDPVRAALLAQEAGADGITAHLREDRRHISDDDIARLSRGLKIPLNLEMAATDEMMAIALRHRPHACCIVPEKREERTTEGGIDVVTQFARLKPIVTQLTGAGIRVSMFIEPDRKQIDASRELGAPVVELHTGAYANASGAARERLLTHIRNGAEFGADIGLEIHAGHGLTYDNVGPVAAIPHIVELNIGHFLIGESVFVGLTNAIARMRGAMNEARQGDFIK